jgi:5-methylcytosine-specific restriction protein A
VRAARAYHDPEVQKLYKTRRWQMIRRLQLAKEPWCSDCLKAGLWVEARQCDHITPHRGDVAAFWRGPFQSLCDSCHSRKTAGEVLNQ